MIFAIYKAAPLPNPTTPGTGVSTKVEAPAPVSRPLGKGAGAADFADPSKLLLERNPPGVDLPGGQDPIQGIAFAPPAADGRNR